MRDDEAGEVREPAGEPDSESNAVANSDTSSIVPAEPPATSNQTSALNRTVGGRPLMVYLVLAAGAATLLLLLFIVWFSGRNDGSSNLQFCTSISAAEA